MKKAVDRIESNRQKVGNEKNDCFELESLQFPVVAYRNRKQVRTVRALGAASNAF